MSKAKRRDVEKGRYWQKVIREAARSGLSIREFCRGRRLKESQFHWWRRKLKARRQERTLHRRVRRKDTFGGQATFALVSDEPGASEAGIELVLSDGRRVRIGKGEDEQTLRTVLAAVEIQFSRSICIRHQMP